MIIEGISPNRVIMLAVLAFVGYLALAMVAPANVLRDVFNSLAFGAQVMVVITWGPAAWEATHNKARGREWLLILAIFFICFVAMMQRVYAITYNAFGQPEAWRQSAIAGFWPFSYTIAGMLFLVSPRIGTDGMGVQAWWMMLAAGVIGGVLTGILIGMSIPSF